MALASDPDPRYVEGIRLFNAHQWFEAHEVLESVWHDDPTPGRSFWQGLIQAAVALEHWRRRNARGARSQWEQARMRLAAYRPRHRGLDVAAFLADMERCMAPLMQDADAPLDGATVPVIRLDRHSERS